MSYLEYQDEMYLNAVNDDACLLVLSRGLGLEQLMVRLCRTYSDETSLVLVIGTEAEEEQFFTNKLVDDKDLPYGNLPQRITAESSSTKKRSEIYLKGGVLFVTERILVVDLLSDRVPIDLVTGIIVYKAHKIYDDCLMSFILRLYRMKNKKGFIKALSQNPQSFFGDFGKLDKIMRALFVTSLHLWPRFHATVQSSLGPPRAQPDVIEVVIPLSKTMKSMQFDIMDLIDMCLKELAKTNTSSLYDSDQLNVENAINKGFDSFIKRRLDGVWHQLGSRAKSLIYDIQYLRNLMFLLFQADLVAFYHQTRAALNFVKHGREPSDWIFWKPADRLFKMAKERLYPNNSNLEDFEAETNLKWKAFQDLIEEIDKEAQKTTEPVHVFVVVASDNVHWLLEGILRIGATNVLRNKVERFKAIMRLNASDDDTAKAIEEQEANAQLPILDCGTKHCLNLHYFSSRDSNRIILEAKLNQYKPLHVIMYDLDMHAIRQIEVYQALLCHPKRCKIYTIQFENSVDMQKYLTSLRREKEAFESLIREKATMVIPTGRDGKTDGHPDLVRGETFFANETTDSVNTRRAGGQVDRNDIIKQKILVDMREFRSELPSTIHKRGIEIEPIQLEIGDYILSTDTCVERKSISDLIQSLQTGRLHNQAAMMIRHFKRSILLIEFDESKSFHFKGRYFGTTSGKQDIVDKLILLTIHHPNLKIVWSPSTYFTAELFEYLKMDRDQPDPKRIAMISSEELPPETFEDKYDLQVKDFLMKLPGVNTRNVYSIMNCASTLADLVDVSIEQFQEMMPTKSAELFYKTLHVSLRKFATDAIRLEQENKKKSLFSCTKRRKGMD